MDRVVIHLTAAEYQAAERAIIGRLQHQVSGLAVSRWGGSVGGAIVGLCLFALTKAEYPPSERSNLSVMAVLGLLLLGIAIYFGAQSLSKALVAKRLYGPGSKLLRPYLLALEPEALLVESDGFRAQFSWGNVEAVEATDAQALLFTSPSNAIPVPARAFPSPAEYQTFISALKALAASSGA